MFTFMNDAEDDPFFGAHVRHMRQMNNMMSSMMADPFGMFGGGMGGMLASPLAAPRHSSALMPFMPPMNMNRLLSSGLEAGMMPGSSYSSSTVVMSSGLNGRPQVISSTSSTKVGPNGVKETRKTLEDSRTGTKTMAVGHHIGERAHVIEREQNVYSGEQEERQDFINIEEEEADDFNREFQVKAGVYVSPRAHIVGPAPAQLALPAPAQLALPAPAPSAAAAAAGHAQPQSHQAHNGVRDVYGGAQPRQRARPAKPRPSSPRRSPLH